MLFARQRRYPSDPSFQSVTSIDAVCRAADEFALISGGTYDRPAVGTYFSRSHHGRGLDAHDFATGGRGFDRFDYDRLRASGFCTAAPHERTFRRPPLSGDGAGDSTAV